MELRPTADTVDVDNIPTDVSDQAKPNIGIRPMEKSTSTTSLNITHRTPPQRRGSSIPCPRPNSKNRSFAPAAPAAEIHGFTSPRFRTQPFQNHGYHPPAGSMGYDNRASARRSPMYPGAFPKRPFMMEHFSFRRRRDRLNWRLLGGVQVEKIIREVDIQSLQEIIENVTFCDLEAEDLRYVDPNIVKLFQLSQLIIEYLLHSQDYLSFTHSASLEELEITAARLDEALKSQEAGAVENASLKKENRALKKTLYAYQVVSKIPNVGYSHPETKLHRCHYCAKAFSSVAYLDNHFKRRHPDEYEHTTHPPPPVPAPAPVPVPVPQPAPSQTVHIIDRQTSTTDLKGRPVETAPVQQPPQLPVEQINQINALSVLPSVTQKISETVEDLKKQMLETEAKLRIELEQRVATELARRTTVLEDAYASERLRYQKELQDLKSSVHVELSQERAELAEEKEAFRAFLVEQASARPRSFVGTMEDEDEESESRPPPLNLDEGPVREKLEQLCRESQDKQKLESYELLRQFEEHQSAVIQSLADRLSEDMGAMRKGLLTEQEKDRKVLEERINRAATQLHMLQLALVEEHKQNEEREMERRSNDEKRTKELLSQAEAARADAARAEAARAETAKMMAARQVEEPPKKVEKVVKEVSKVEIIPKVTELPKTTENVAPVEVPRQAEVKLIDNIKTVIRKLSVQDFDAEPQKTAQKEEPVDLLELLKTHVCTPNAMTPWVKTLFSHQASEFGTQKVAIEQQIDYEMSRRGITKKSIVDRWGLDPNVGLEYGKQVITLDMEIKQKNTNNPNYGRLHRHLEEQVDILMNIYNRPGTAKPHPIITRINSFSAASPTPLVSTALSTATTVSPGTTTLSPSTATGNPALLSSSSRATSSNDVKPPPLLSTASSAGLTPQQSQNARPPPPNKSAPIPTPQKPAAPATQQKNTSNLVAASSEQTNERESVASAAPPKPATSQQNNERNSGAPAAPPKDPPNPSMTPAQQNNASLPPKKDTEQPAANAKPSVSWKKMIPNLGLKKASMSKNNEPSDIETTEDLESEWSNDETSPEKSEISSVADFAPTAPLKSGPASGVKTAPPPVTTKNEPVKLPPPSAQQKDTGSIQNLVPAKQQQPPSNPASAPQGTTDRPEPPPKSAPMPPKPPSANVTSRALPDDDSSSALDSNDMEEEDTFSDWPEGSSIMDDEGTDDDEEWNGRGGSKPKPRRPVMPLAQMGHVAHSTHTILEEEEDEDGGGPGRGRVSVGSAPQRPSVAGRFAGGASRSLPANEPEGRPSSTRRENTTAQPDKGSNGTISNRGLPADTRDSRPSVTKPVKMNQKDQDVDGGKDDNSFDLSELSSISAGNGDSLNVSNSSLGLSRGIQEIVSSAAQAPAKHVDSDEDSNFSDLDDLDDTIQLSRPPQVTSAGFSAKAPTTKIPTSTIQVKSMPVRERTDSDLSDIMDDIASSISERPQRPPVTGRPAFNNVPPTFSATRRFEEEDEFDFDFDD